MRTTRTLPCVVLATAVSLALTACHKEGGQQQAPQQRATQVSVITVQPQDVTLTTTLPGRTTAYRVSEVRPQVSGILQRRLFKEGSEVRAGQPLYQIDPSTYKATLDRAEASLTSAKLLADRYDKLIERHAISQQNRDDAYSAYLQAKATLESARIDMNHTRITAPISGRIGRSSVTEGALVTASQATALATVQQLDPIYVDISQPSTSLLHLREELASGQIKQVGKDQAEVKLVMENGQTYGKAGKLQFSEVSVDEGTGAVTLRAVFPNPDHLLLPGMFVHASLDEGVRSNAILVPQKGITHDTTGQATALVVGEGNKAEQRILTLGRTVGNKWIVTSGLKVGDRVIVDGLMNLRPGTEVAPTPATDSDTPAPAASAPVAAASQQ